VQLIGNEVVLSATDLNNALACAHLTTLDLAALRGELERPDGRPKEAILLADLGEKHEQRYLRQLQDEHGLEVVCIDKSVGPEAAARATEAAMASGAHVIYQATFFDGTWIGYADFLRRVDAPDAGGRWAWHYEVEDTKLARHTEPYFLLQLCYYSEHVARIQGVEPTRMYVVLGDGSPRKEFRVAEFSAYYRRVKKQFLERLGAQADTYPYPNDHCTFCVWNPTCEGRRAADDHLTGVANIRRLQVTRLTDDGITTLRELALASPDATVPGMHPRTYRTLQRQARLQHEQRLAIAHHEPNPYRYELLADGVVERRGFHLMPEPSDGDVFFDMEGHPFYDIGTGLEYLFGAVTADDGVFHAFWGCDRSEWPVADRLAERRAFEAFIDFVLERRERFPAMHVFHYAPYEKTALTKLSERHATREEEVATLLREGVLVDLYAVVRQSVVVGQPSYSIKKIEEFYGKRGTASGVAGGGESILRFDEWLTLRSDPSLRDDAILDDLEQYNRYDCESTQGLRDWLLALRLDAHRDFSTDVPWFTGPPPVEDPPARVTEFDDLKLALDNRIPKDYDPDTVATGNDAVRPFFLVRHMLEYHAREDRPVWWQFHDRCAAFVEDPESLLEDTESIVDLTLIGEPERVKQSYVYEFSYPTQLHKIDGGTCYDPSTKLRAGTIVTIADTDDGGRLKLSRGPKLAQEPLPTAITIRDLTPRKPVIDAIARFGEALVAGEPSRYAAAYDVLTKSAPRLRGRGAGTVVAPDVVDETSVGAVLGELDRSYVFIQGPPGAGKTTLASGLIATLLARGCTVGVTANSHKSVHNLLDAVVRVAAARGVGIRGLKKCTKDAAETQYDSPAFENQSDMAGIEGFNLIAGTAWAFGKKELDQALDFLFIDEAGQMALPLAIAAMTSARDVVLLGDPQQLAQVSHAKHPGDLGCSVLDHLLETEEKTIPPERGIFMHHSYRMHPDVCRFISETMYDGELRSAAGREQQDVMSPGLSGTGLRLLPVAHAGNSQHSIAEAEAIADEIELLLRGTVRTVDGIQRPLTADDVIVVSPYNAQVRCIRATLARRGIAGVQVGTVDKFQGREAYVVFFSTAASTAEDAPRGARFIFDRQRLNVAVSRARALAVMVGSPALLDLTCSSIDDVRIANGVCRFLELLPTPEL
jgi:uncharacterized protein